MAKKHKILEKLDKYLENASPEQLKQDWAELEQYNHDGPDILDLLTRRVDPEQCKFQIDLYKKLLEGFNDF
jgi:hypothetical protein